MQRLLAAAPDPDAALAALRARQPTGRLVTAEEVAHAVCYLASPLARATNPTTCGPISNTEASYTPWVEKPDDAAATPPFPY